MRMVRYMVLQCLNPNILFKAKHISGKKNILADCLSRRSSFEDGSTCLKGTKPCAKPAAVTELLECIGVLTKAALALST